MSAEPPHIAIIRDRMNDEIARAVIIPVDVDWRSTEDRAWLNRYLGEHYRLDTFVPVIFVADEPSDPRTYPAGEPNEAEIRARIARALEPLVVIIRRGDLDRLDKVVAFAEAMAELWSGNFADDLWNLRNGILPYRPGDVNFIPEDGAPDTAEIAILRKLRIEVEDWREALSGERAGLDELCAEVDALIGTSEQESEA